MNEGSCTISNDSLAAKTQLREIVVRYGCLRTSRILGFERTSIYKMIRHNHEIRPFNRKVIDEQWNKLQQIKKSEQWHR